MREYYERVRIVKDNAKDKLKEVAIKRAHVSLKKTDQLNKLAELKRQRQLSMQQLQAKHFMFDLRRKLNNRCIQDTLLKNQKSEQVKKLSISKSGVLDRFVIKEWEHLNDISGRLAKADSDWEDLRPTGLKTISLRR